MHAHFRLFGAAALMTLALATGGATAQTVSAEGQWLRYPGMAEVQLRDVAAIVRVIPETRTDIGVQIVNSGPLPAPEIRSQRQRLIIDGDQRRQVRSCRTLEGGGFEVNLRRQGVLRNEQLPTITLRVPRDVVLAAGNAVQLHMGQADAARVSLDGCGDADLEGVTGMADVSIAGAPNFRLYEAGEASVSVAGGGDVTLGVVHRGLTVSIAGAGDVVVARADGPTSVAVQGSGDIVIRDGRASPFSVSIVGAGDVSHNGVAERLDVAIIGAGDVRVSRVEGEVTRRILGAGDVIIGR